MLTTTEPCNAKKCGEYNMLRCCDSKGHNGDHCYVVDHENDYAHNKTKPTGAAAIRKLALQGDYGAVCVHCNGSGRDSATKGSAWPFPCEHCNDPGKQGGAGDESINERKQS